MKYPRNLRVCKGHLDFAPFVGVLFLLVLFLLLHSSLVFIPGVRLTGGPGPGLGIDSAWVVLRGGDRVEFDGRTYAKEKLEARFRELQGSNRLPSSIQVSLGPGVLSSNLVWFREWLHPWKISMATPSQAIRLPEGVGGPGLTNARVAVALNLSGQIFYDNRLCSEQELRLRLAGAAASASAPLTLVVMADEAVPQEAVMKVMRLARESGIHDFFVATQPAIFERRNRASSGEEARPQAPAVGGRPAKPR